MPLSKLSVKEEPGDRNTQRYRYGGSCRKKIEDDDGKTGKAIDTRHSNPQVLIVERPNHQR
jgi:hypothetical protein